MIILISLLIMLCAAIFFYAIRNVSEQALTAYQGQIEAQANVTLAEMFLFISPQKLMALNIFAMIIVWVLTLIFVGNPVVAAVAGAAAGFAPKIMIKKLRKRRINAFLAQLPDALQSVSTSMRVGASFKAALEQTVKEQKPPLAQELGLVLKEIRVGVEYDDAFRNLETRMPLDEVNLLVSAVLINKEVGGNLADMLGKLSSTIRRKLEMEGKIDALTAQGRMQGWVMTGLPIFVGIALYHIEPEAMGRITTELSGWVVIIISSILLGAGYFFIQKIVRIDV